MGRVAIHPSKVLAELCRRRREELGLSLRDVQARSAESGDRVHFATLARFEQGRVEMGARRLYRLLKLYDLPIQLAADLLDLEDSAGAAVPKGSFEEMAREGVDFWRSGNLRGALARIFAVRSRTPAGAQDRVKRQKALLEMAVAAGGVGRVALSRHIIEGLLFEPPDPSLLVPILTQAARCWHGLGSFDGALGFVARAEALLQPRQLQERAWVFHEKASILANMGDLAAAGVALGAAMAAYRRARDAYGEARALAVQVRLHRERSDWQGTLRAARAAKALCRRHGFKRLTAARGLDEAKALRSLSRDDAALGVLREVLAWAIQEDDRVVRFYAHHALWKTYEAMKDGVRATAELRAAQDHVQFVDELTPETREVRDLQPKASAAITRPQVRSAS